MRGVFSSGKSDGADFLDQHTLLQVCHHVAAELERGTTKSCMVRGVGVL